LHFGGGALRKRSAVRASHVFAGLPGRAVPGNLEAIVSDKSFQNATIRAHGHGKRSCIAALANSLSLSNLSKKGPIHESRPFQIKRETHSRRSFPKWDLLSRNFDASFVLAAISFS
jgi:hypothetical protein